jgi:hypothetical protein
MNIKMNTTTKKRWLNALRSGEYLQGKNKLRDVENYFCCLGVLCDLHSKEFQINWERPNLLSHYVYLGEGGVHPPDVSEWAWPAFGHGTPIVTINGKSKTLDYHNDDGRTFEEIANAIEEQL